MCACSVGEKMLKPKLKGGRFLEKVRPQRTSVARHPINCFPARKLILLIVLAIYAGVLSSCYLEVLTIIIIGGLARTSCS